MKTLIRLFAVAVLGSLHACALNLDIGPDGQIEGGQIEVVK